MTPQQTNRELERLIAEIDVLSRDVEKRGAAVASGLRKAAATNGATRLHPGRYRVRVLNGSARPAAKG